MNKEEILTWRFVLETLLKWFIPVCAAGLGGFVFVKLRNMIHYGAERTRQEEWDKYAEELTAEVRANKEDSDEQDRQIEKRIDKVDKDLGLLTKSNRLQNLRGLQRGGRELLEKGHITTAEYRQFEEEYQVYKDCGGDGWADDIHEAVRQMYHNSLSGHKKNGDAN